MYMPVETGFPVFGQWIMSSPITLRLVWKRSAAGPARIGKAAGVAATVQRRGLHRRTVKHGSLTTLAIVRQV